MDICLYVLCLINGMILICLILKIIVMRKSMKEISEKFTDRLITDTNTLMDISSRDIYVRRLAEEINKQLRVYRKERHRFYQGDLELKEAITNISHDLRTPLTTICGYLELIKKGDIDKDTARYLSMIENRTEVLIQLTEELFRYSVIVSVEDDKLDLVNINHILQESLVAYYDAFKERHMTPEISLPEEGIERNVNRSALIRVFNNIITNVLKYSDGDFLVSMNTEGKIVFSNKAKNLNPVLAGRLFERFYTVETGRNSTGLGLSIAKILMERMGGSITASYHDDRLYITLIL